MGGWVGGWVGGWMTYRGGRGVGWERAEEKRSLLEGLAPC